MARRLALPRGAPRLQQDVRRRASPWHAGRSRRLLLVRRHRLRRRVVPLGRTPPHRLRRRAHRLVDLRRHDPRGDRRRRSARARSSTISVSPGRSRSSWQSSASCSGSPTACRRKADRRARLLAGILDRDVADPGADAGVSRSGITITAGRFIRLDRDAAARFAFLLLIPIVFGAVVFKGLKDVVLNPLPAGSVGPFVVGTLAAAAVGLVAIDLLLGYVRRHDYSVFVIYRLALSAAIVLVIVSGWRGSTSSASGTKACRMARRDGGRRGRRYR